ncbi:MAG: nucleotidyltransferase domain-containing protein [Anaerolinea sp.]|nr:nucleotidyltransferase domain-containing protein [Anaerolinea sp.]
MNISEVIQFWLDSAEDDWPVAGHLIASGDYHYALFFAHLHTEKLLAEIRTQSRKATTTAGKERVIAQVQDLLRVLRAQDLTISAAYLYGSHATGTAGPDSDIDVAVVSPDLTGDRLQDWIRLTITATSIDPRFEVIGFRPEQFRDEHPLAWEVKTQGIPLS